MTDNTNAGDAAGAPQIPGQHLFELGLAVERLNDLVAELIERHGEHYDIRMWPRVREDEPPRVSVSVTRIFAEFGK